MIERLMGPLLVELLAKDIEAALLRSKLVQHGRTNKKTPATEASRAEGSMHAVAQSAQTPGGDAARGELFAGLVRAARRVVAQKAKKTKAVRRRAAKPIGKKR